LLANRGIDAVAGDESRRPNRGRNSAFHVLEEDGDALFVLLEARALAAGHNTIGAELRPRGLKKNPVQLAAMNADLGVLIASVLAARLLVDELAEAVEKAAFQIFD